MTKKIAVKKTLKKTKKVEEPAIIEKKVIEEVRFDTLGGSKMRILSVEDTVINGKDFKKIVLLDGSITVLSADEYLAQLNQ